MKRTKRSWTVEEKQSIIKEAETAGMIETCRKYGIYQSTYYYWKEKYDRDGIAGLEPQYVKKNPQEVTRLQRENYKLKQILAEKELELQFKADLLKKKTQRWKNERK